MSSVQAISRLRRHRNPSFTFCLIVQCVTEKKNECLKTVCRGLLGSKLTVNIHIVNKGSILGNKQHRLTRRNELITWPSPSDILGHDHPLRTSKWCQKASFGGSGGRCTFLCDAVGPRQAVNNKRVVGPNDRIRLSNTYNLVYL